MRAALVGSLLASLACQSAHAAAGVWAAAVDGDWSDTTKWTGGTIANGAAFNATFNVGGTTAYIVTLDGPRTVASISKGTAASASVTIYSASAANVLTLDNGATNSQINNQFNGNTTTTVDADIALNSNLTLSGNGNNNAKVVLGSLATPRTITGAKNITINNTATNSGGVITIYSNINTSGTVANTSSQGSSNHRIYGVIGSTVAGVALSSARTLVLHGANTYTGPTSVSGGVLQAAIASVPGVSGAFGNNSAVTIANVNGSTLSLGGFATQIGSLAGGGTTGGTVSIGASRLTTGGNNTSTTYSGNMTGSGGLTKIGSGTQTLEAAVNYTGTTIISAGTLALGASGTISASSGFNLGTLASRGTLDLTSKASFAFGAAQTVSGDGTINIGAGKAVTINGNLAPGNNAGIVSVTGGLVLADAATLGNSTGAITTMELAGNGGVVGTDYDKVDVTEQLTLGGTLNIVGSGSYTLNQAGTYTLFSFGSQTGNFDFVTVGGASLLNSGGTWTGTSSGFSYTFSPVGGTLVLTVAASSGLSAVETWRQTNFGSSANTGTAADSADPDNDGLSNLIEYATGTSPNTANAAVVTVGSSAGFLTLTYTRIADTTLTYTVEGSSDLTTWATVNTGNNPSTGVANVAGQVTVTDTTALTTRRFLRLKIAY